MNISVKALLEKYVEGKDYDKYQILEEIYSPRARVSFTIETRTITFPAEILGRIEIAKALSVDFNKQYDNIRTYYLSDDFSGPDDLVISRQPWLVLMREKDTGNIRVGTGCYDWELERHPVNGLTIREHTITIAVMLSLPEDHFSLLEKVEETLSYPWVDITRAIEVLAGYSQASEVSNYLLNRWSQPSST